MDGVLYSGTGVTGAATGAWFALSRNWQRTHVAASLQITAGTATVVLEGRNGPGDSPVSLKSLTATEGIMAASFPQMRVVVSGASGATIRVSVDSTLLATT